MRTETLAEQLTLTTVFVHGPLPDCTWVPLLCVHDSILSKVGVSGKGGAVHPSSSALGGAGCGGSSRQRTSSPRGGGTRLRAQPNFGAESDDHTSFFSSTHFSSPDSR